MFSVSQLCFIIASRKFKSVSTMFQDCLENCHWCFTSVLWIIQGSSKEVVRVVQVSQLLKCWLQSRRKEVASDLTVNQAEISVVLDIVKAIAVSDVFIEGDE